MGVCAAGSFSLFVLEEFTGVLSSTSNLTAVLGAFSVESALVTSLPIISIKSSSDIICTPSFVAFCNFAGPILCPANRYDVLADTAARFFPP